MEDGKTGGQREKIPKKPLPPKTTIFLGMIAARLVSILSAHIQDISILKLTYNRG